MACSRGQASADIVDKKRFGGTFASVTISLPEALEKAVQRRVESGLYSDPSDVIREALRHSLSKEIDEDSLRREAEVGFLDLDQGRSNPVGTFGELAALVRGEP